jgi:hypothetical protein
MPAAAIAIPAVVSLIQSQGQGATQGQTAAGTQLSQNAATQSAIGGPALGQAAGYFSKLAGGNRATMTQALAPQISDINSVYGGTARTLARFTRGPTAQVAQAGAEQQRAGQIGSMFSTARTGANAELAGIGQGALTGSTSAAAGAGGVFGQQAGQALQAGVAGGNMEMQAGAGIGNLLFNLMKAGKGTAGGGMTNLFGTGSTSGLQGPGGG